MDFSVATPSEVSPEGDLARQLAHLVGPAVQAPDGSVAAAEYLALGDVIQDARDATTNALRNAFVDTAVELLTELEDEYGLPSRPDATNASRQAALTARVRGYAGTLDRIVSALTPLLTTTSVGEVPLAAAGVPEDVFRFGVVMTAKQLQDSVLVSLVNEQLQVSAPAHTNWEFGNAFGFLTDDSASLTDLTLLGS
jgi:hypothetical protein